MREAVELTGVVLEARPVGEFDRRLVILTGERGRITAFAHGARRPKSPLIAASSPFVFATFSLYEGRDAYTLAEADVKEYFSGLTGRMPGVLYAFYCLELASWFTREGVEAAGIVNLLFVTLRAIEKEQMPVKLIRRVYELRMLTENGEYAPPEEQGNLSRSAWYALRFASEAGYGRLYSFALSEPAAEEFSAAVRKAMRRVVDKPFKTLAVIDEMK
ncbi:DNA repair protein RecO [Chordicoccus furentiruminis]|jgi:DNA repair protein RecO (recombination protein O)|uniref:DNA repair protein RecO n=1 Tax=Chordicoccus furentiruminis TaxID=2709410 RepID=UPI0023A821B8|nr:DNA repair protein RecO [Chordicoccus furentiruminis]